MSQSDAPAIIDEHFAVFAFLTAYARGTALRAFGSGINGIMGI